MIWNIIYYWFIFFIFQQVEDSLGNVGVGEREFLISPNYGSVVMSALGYTQPTDSKILQQKNTFAWMHEEQFHNLQVLLSDLYFLNKNNS
jgi:hypothetical protein